MVCNAKKSVCMIFEPRERSKIMSVSYPQFMIGGSLLQYVKVFKYLGHMITDTLYDDEDLQREIRNLFTRTNVYSLVVLPNAPLMSQLHCININNKYIIYKAYCISLLDCGGDIK